MGAGMLRTDLQLQRLRAKHGRDRSLVRQFPDLQVVQHHRSLGDGFAPVVWHPPQTYECGLTVSHLHKSGYQVVSKSELPFVGRKV